MYEFYTEPCQVGQIYDATIRRISSETVAATEVNGISFGAPITYDANQNVINIDPNATPATADRLIGITVFDQMKINSIYPAQDRVSVMNFGRIWVQLDLTLPGSSIAAGVVAYVANDGNFSDLINAGSSEIKAGLFLDSPTTLEDGTIVAPLELNLEI